MKNPFRNDFFRSRQKTICAVRCASQKVTLAMRCIFTAICALAAEIYCDVAKRASPASAMPRCGDLACMPDDGGLFRRSWC